jgi:hypothetical protein
MCLIASARFQVVMMMMMMIIIIIKHCLYECDVKWSRRMRVCFRGITASILRLEYDDCGSTIIWNTAHFFRLHSSASHRQRAKFKCFDFKGSALRILSANTRSFIGPFHYPFCLQSVSILRGVRKRGAMLCRKLPGSEFFMHSLCVAVSSVIRNSDIVILEHQSHEHISRVSYHLF